ncbi:MAG: GntR family transcriptional regulator, partial [Chloroflexi bacterium]|nr:GntR family transcriptional regulator [Chloroflexota bacterium]
MSDAFQRIEKLNLRANVVKQVQDLVRTGQLGPEARLPSERDLQRQLNVSRPLLREALHELTHTGIIEARHGRGWFIIDIARSRLLSAPLSQYLLHGEISISELLQTRILIESEAARLAAKAAGPSEITELNRMLRAIEAAREDSDENVQLDTAFHTRIASIAGNRLLVRILDSMQDLLTEYRHLLIIGVPDRVDAANEEHRRIVAAITRHESDSAAAEMRAHIEAI